MLFSHYDLQAIFITLERLITYLKHCCHFSACSWELTCHFLVEVSVSTITACSCTFENSLSKSQSVRKHLQHKYYNKSWERVDEIQFTSFIAWEPIFLDWITYTLSSRFHFFSFIVYALQDAKRKKESLWISQNSFQWLDIWLAYSLRLVFASLASYSSRLLSLGKRDNYC